MISRRFAVGSIGAAFVGSASAEPSSPETAGSGPVPVAPTTPVDPITDADAKVAPAPAPPPHQAAAGPNARDISAGLTPLHRVDAAGWSQVMRSFYSLYGPFHHREGPLASSPPPPPAVDPKLLEYAQQIDKSAQDHFRYSHVEILLDQAS